MKGFVPTPRQTVDTMVGLLFRGRPPTAESTLLDPGCGTGVEADPRHLPALRAKYDRIPAVRIEHGDFLLGGRPAYDFIVLNPPYVAITALSEDEKARYRARYATARGRFDLYVLFFEQALRNLAPGGRLVFITPEKYLYVETAGPLRDLLADHHVEQIRLVPEDTFGDLVTYPTITVVRNARPRGTRIVRRDGSRTAVDLPPGRESWLPLVEGALPQRTAASLRAVCLRISCGVATGADGVFVQPEQGLDPALRPFAHPTVAGRELAPAHAELPRRSVMLVPYDADGRLLPLEQLGAFGRYLGRENVRRRLLARTCVQHKPWYAFHETPPLQAMLRPKILCKDIGEMPHFWLDRSGDIVPRHSVYYIVPRDPSAMDVLMEYLRSPAAHEWLTQNCQRAAKGYLRLQSRVLQRLPLPDDVARSAGGERAQTQDRAGAPTPRAAPRGGRCGRRGGRGSPRPPARRPAAGRSSARTPRGRSR